MRALALRPGLVSSQPADRSSSLRAPGCGPGSCRFDSFRVRHPCEQITLLLVGVSHEGADKVTPLCQRVGLAFPACFGRGGRWFESITVRAFCAYETVMSGICYLFRM